MQIKADKLTESVQKRLLPVYLVFGDEYFLVEEASDVIRQQARKLGADERHVWHVDDGFNWSTLNWHGKTMSLFASKRLLEIRLPSGSPGREGAEVIRRYVAKPPPDTTLIIISGAIDKRSQKSKWFVELGAVGATVAVWPIPFAMLPRWIIERAQKRHLRMSEQVATLIAERIEGNLFAAAQEVDKLQLLCPSGEVDEKTVLDTVIDSARFKSFDLMSAAFNGEIAKIPRMIAKLRAEGLRMEQVLAAVSWSLHRPIDMAIQLEQGKTIEQVLTAQRIWERDKAMMRGVLKRHNNRQWQTYLQDISSIDQAVKGITTICPWLLLERLCIKVAQ